MLLCILYIIFFLLHMLDDILNFYYFELFISRPTAQLFNVIQKNFILITINLLKLGQEKYDKRYYIRCCLQNESL